MRLGLTKDEILKGNIISGLIKLALPLMLLNLINTLYGIVDTYFVGKINELQVAAVSLVTPITNCGIAFSSGLSAAGIALIARSLGQRDYDKARKIATHLIMLCFVLGSIITLLSIVFSSQIMSWFNTPSDIYKDTLAYFIVVSFDYICLFILTIFQAIRQSCGDSKSGTKLNIIASILNGCLDPLFIFGFNFGTFGAGLATVLSKAIVVPFALKSLLDQENTVYISFKENKLDMQMMKSIITVALPASFGQFLSSFGFVLMSKEIVSYGSIVMSGYGIGSHVSSIFYIPVDSIGMALPTYIGQNIGADNIDRAKKSYKDALKLVIMMAICVIFAGFLTAKYFVYLFVKNASDELLRISLEYSYFSIATAIFMGWFNSLCGVFNGSSNTKISMVLSASRILFIRMPIVYLLRKITNLGYTGIWVSMIISNLITCTIGQILYIKYPWYNIKNK